MPPTMRKPLIKKNIIKIAWNLSKGKSGHLHLRHNLYAKYQDPSPSRSPDSLFTRSFRPVGKG